VTGFDFSAVSAELLRLMKPQPCPMPLVRLGGCGDGAYLIPDDLDGIEACFSPGVDNFKNFEDELTLGYGIQCHMCDFASDIEQFQTPLVEGHQTFDKKWLDPDGVIDSISLDDWVNRYCPGSQDLILQMDIEGAEYKNILASDPVLLSRFRIIVLELHWLCDAVKEGESSQLFALLQKLYQTHRVVHAHANNCCGEHIDPGSGISIPNIIELTYLRLNREIRISIFNPYFRIPWMFRETRSSSHPYILVPIGCLHLMNHHYQ
jgi:hypothetical protein